MVPSKDKFLDTYEHTYPSIHLKCSIKSAVLKNIPILTGNHLCWILIVAGPRRDQIS